MTKLTTYRYHGPASSATLLHEGESLSVLLIPDQTVELPGQHPYTQALVAQEYLVAQAAEPESAAPQADTPSVPADAGTSANKSRKGE